MSSAQNLSHGAHGFDLADRILRVFEIFCRDWQHDHDPFAMVRHHGLVVVDGLSRLGLMQLARGEKRHSCSPLSKVFQFIVTINGLAPPR
jgi:hypothetical protein